VSLANCFAQDPRPLSSSVLTVCALNALFASVTSEIYRKYPREAVCFVVRIREQEEFLYRR
jgi:hypothetical protein